mmetsp:Transcript_1910/g.4334  ORF Transcript_1910/g.4334 Transcript_1910/m.4334 type:complete len:1136 (+) Transcript_1910:112-3519(+)
MAIDGVAPRAKMNQQRSRRFRSAQDAEEKAMEEERMRKELEAQGIKLPKAEKSELHDSNTITPGTPFMDRLATALQYYVHMRLNSDPGWQDIEVILSDSNTPGEGEHKAMAYVREQRGRPGWNPNTKHVVYGLDADLIMLAMATHEPHFYILREVVFQQTPQEHAAANRPQFYSKNDSNSNNNNGGAPGDVSGQKRTSEKEIKKPEIARKPFQLLSTSILREYLALEMKNDDLPFPFDPERILDDFVFMCFFVGNDFLPHMPTLDIREGAIELMMRIYKNMLPQLGGYLCHGSKVNLQRAEMFIQTVGSYEDTIFQKRMRELRRQKDRVARQRQQKEQDKARSNAAGQKLRADEAGPSQAHFQAIMAAGEVVPARSRARAPMDLSSSVPKQQAGSAYTAAGMTAAIQREEAAAAAAGGPKGPLPQPSPAPTPALQAQPPPAEPTIDNKSAASRLRAMMAGGKKTVVESDAEMTKEEEEVAKKRVRLSPEGKGLPQHLRFDSNGEEVKAEPGVAPNGQVALPVKQEQEPTAVPKQEQEEKAAVPHRAAAAPAKADLTTPLIKEEGNSAPVKEEGLGPKVKEEAKGALPAEQTAAAAEAGAGKEEDISFAQLQNMPPVEAMEEEEVVNVLAGDAFPGEDEEAMEEEEEEEVPPLTEEQIARNKKAADDLKSSLDNLGKDRADRFDSMYDEEVNKIRLDETGWKGRYYHEKLGVPVEAQADVVSDIVKSYVEGLCWVMSYYYDGCVSWRWYYPFHYAPFASDLKNLSSYNIEFDYGEPFTPFNQLMGVLPAASAHCLPEAFRPLFTAPDSPILDFYPKDFTVDMNGKRFAWQGVALLPFIDEERLLRATSALLHKLSPEEKRRNSKRMELLLVKSTHPLAPTIYELESKFSHLKTDEERAQQAIVPISTEKSNGMSGFLILVSGEACPPVIPAPFDLGEDITNNQVLCACYRLPPHKPHEPKIMEGTQLDEPLLTEADKPHEEPLWHEKGPRGPHMRQNTMAMGDAAHRTIAHSLGGRGGYGGGAYGGGRGGFGVGGDPYGQYGGGRGAYGGGRFAAVGPAPGMYDGGGMGGRGMGMPGRGGRGSGMMMPGPAAAAAAGLRCGGHGRGGAWQVIGKWLCVRCAWLHPYQRARSRGCSR